MLSSHTLIQIEHMRARLEKALAHSAPVVLEDAYKLTHTTSDVTHHPILGHYCLECAIREGEKHASPYEYDAYNTLSCICRTCHVNLTLLIRPARMKSILKHLSPLREGRSLTPADISTLLELLNASLTQSPQGFNHSRLLSICEDALKTFHSQ